MSGIDLIQSLLPAALGRVPYFPTDEEVAEALQHSVDRYTLSPSDKSCMTEIYPTCEERPLFSPPGRFPSPWDYPQTFRMVPFQLLRDTEFRRMIPAFHAPNDEIMDEIEADKRHFWNMLVAIGPRIAESLPQILNRPLGNPLRILDVGCGQGWAARPLLSYFGKKRFETVGDPSTVSYLGIDIDEGEIHSAKQKNSEVSNLTFLVANATRYKDYPQLSRAKFDIILIRHPAVFERDAFRFMNPMWYKIFKEAYEHLAAGGLLIVTAYNCDEFTGADQALSCLGARRLFAAQNPYSANIVLYGRGHNWRDAYVGFFTRE